MFCGYLWLIKIWFNFELLFLFSVNESFIFGVSCIVIIVILNFRSTNTMNNCGIGLTSLSVFLIWKRGLLREQHR
jgi:hypothetical protein